MPVGSVDYVSTAPWNDPYNPWPAYAQLTLSAADLTVPSDTYVLNVFNPNDALLVNYNGVASDGNQLLQLTDDGVWRIYDDVVGEMYILDTARRGIPAGWLQGNTNWIPVDGPRAENTISIIADVTYLTPWEYRRRRLLEIM